MDSFVGQSIDRSWTIESESTSSSNAPTDESSDACRQMKYRNLLFGQDDGKRWESGEIGGRLNRQSSTVTQVISNLTIDNIKSSCNGPSYDDIRSKTISGEPGHVNTSSFFDEDKTTYSNTTGTTDPASFFANTPNTSSLAYTSFSEANSEGDCRLDGVSCLPTLPLHLEDDRADLLYYRVVYRGVVPLLSAPFGSAPRNGAYLSYGEVVACQKTETVYSDRNLTKANNPHSPPRPPQRLNAVSSDTTTARPMPTIITSLPPPPPPPPLPHSSKINLNYKDRKCGDNQVPTNNNASILKVCKILTGGYAMDAPYECDDCDLDSETPKRSNAGEISLERHFSSQRTDVKPEWNSSTFPGYLLTAKESIVVAEPLSSKPLLEEGTCIYKITSCNPLPVLTGPSFDSPKTKALLLPGAIVEVSLKICFDPEGSGAFFLRLSHRRGWIADRQDSATGKMFKAIPAAMEMSVDDHIGDDRSLSGFSSASAGLSSVTAASRRRYRPPRRRENNVSHDISFEKGFPRQMMGKPPPLRNAGHEAVVTERLVTPSSNVSILSFDSSFDHGPSNKQTIPTSPDTSYVTNASAATNKSTASVSTNSYFYLMHVTAPSGLKILDAPQFQVNHLIRGMHFSANVASSHSVSMLESSIGPPKKHHSIFQTMSGRLTTTGPSKAGSQAVFDASSKTRILPRGTLFEASRRMENTGAFSQGAGLIKLSDNSGWAIVPRQDELDRQYRNFAGGIAGVKEGEATRSFEEVGNAVVGTSPDESFRSGCGSGVWIRVITRVGVRVSCTPHVSASDGDVSPSGSSSLGVFNNGSAVGPVASSDSDVASSVGSSFLDAMFRTPKRREGERSQDPSARPATKAERNVDAGFQVIPCGYFAEVERWMPFDGRSTSHQFVRLRGGQGWIQLSASGKTTAIPVPRPEIRCGSFWFRVLSLHGIKVRFGPSKKAPSIKSEEGNRFRFECGEFLRASEVISVFSDDGKPLECFAKLYRNRHVQLHANDKDFVQLVSLTSQAEWVQVFDDNELFLEECASEPRIERHKQGWRYNVIPDSGVVVRRGPSFSSEQTGITLLDGESILINERVSPPGDEITWLRMKDGQGWVSDVDENGGSILIPHSLKHRAQLNGKQRKPDSRGDESEIAYNAIISRLFNNSGGLSEISGKTAAS